MVETRGSATAGAGRAQPGSPGSSTFSRPRRQPPGRPASVPPAAGAGANTGAAAPAAAPLPPGITPAMAAQLAAVAPALAAFAAAYAPAGSGSASSGRSQPEVEPGDDDPENATPGVREEATTADKKTDKIDLRNIRLTMWDGTVAPGSFDAKAREFCGELSDQMDTAQILAGQVWSDQVKKAVMLQFVTGMARRWLRDWLLANPAASYKDTCDAVAHEFRPVLLGVDIVDKIKHERKRWSETYREFADRLLQMADALEGGKAVPANSRCALVAFVRNAYPKYADFLDTKIDTDCERREQPLMSAVSILSRKAGSDGRLPDRSKAKSDQSSTSASTNKAKAKQSGQSRPKASRAKKPDNDKKRPAEASVAMVERKKRPRTVNTNMAAPSSGVICFDCGGVGHTCRPHVQVLSQISPRKSKQERPNRRSRERATGRRKRARPGRGTRGRSLGRRRRRVRGRRQVEPDPSGLGRVAPPDGPARQPREHARL